MDWFGRGLVSPSVAGRGGSVGAYLRFGLEDATQPEVAVALFVLVSAVGLLLVADRVMFVLARWVWVGLRVLWRGALWVNDRVADAMEKLLVWVSRVLKALGAKGTLINIARGSIVDEAALARALADGTVKAAGLDVFENEPQVPDALLAQDNVVLLPHVGSATRETRQAMGDLCKANLDKWFAERAVLTLIPEL